MPLSAIGRGSAGSSVVNPSALASGSNVEPWRSVETTHGEERDVEELAAVRHALDHREGGQHHGHAPAQARPAQRESLGRGEVVEGRGHRGGQRPGHHHQHQGEHGALQPHVAELAREHQQARVRNRPICATHASPWWKTVIVLRAGICALPSTSPAR